MDRREMKGVQIAHSGKISETPKGWIVPSQSGKGAYLVYKEDGKTKCNCPDCEMRGTKCKHQWAVEYFITLTPHGWGIAHDKKQKFGVNSSFKSVTIGFLWY